ncbi:helix-turn-helix domain-containing protein [Zhaonella formicivorans]|uniref:helix-turn-helix domain-containing protein n=1 Tax=Zhaonella formicivorans TaxID=2528593 RepID=UPI0010EE69D7|nr:helix-turn-helix domain-containing protein [Zhaonella formicivorans]
MKIPVRIISLRRKKGYSTKKFAFLAGINHADLLNIEQGLIEPTILTLERICTALGITLAEFFREDSRAQLPALSPKKQRLIEKIATLGEESIAYLENQADLLKIKESINRTPAKTSAA